VGCLVPGKSCLGDITSKDRNSFRDESLWQYDIPVASGVDIQVREDQGVQGPVFNWPVKRYHMSRIT
jgi:hypothetical protein